MELVAAMLAAMGLQPMVTAVVAEVTQQIHRGVRQTVRAFLVVAVPLMGRQLDTAAAAVVQVQ
jgi:hypothetical protein